MPTNGVNAGLDFKILEPSPAVFKWLAQCFVRRSGCGLLQQISINSPCLLADYSLRHCIYFELLPHPHVISSFNIFPWIDVRCLEIILAPLAGVIAFIDCLCFSIVQIVQALRSYCFAKLTICTPWSCSSIISFFNSMNITRFFSALFFALTFFAPMVGKIKLCKITASTNTNATLMIPLQANHLNLSSDTRDAGRMLWRSLR